MIDKFNEFLFSIGIKSHQDKVLHVIAGGAITLIVGFIAFFAGAEYPQSYGILAGAITGVAKEAVDEYNFRRGRHPEGANFFDIFWTLVAVFFGGLIVTLST